MITQHESSKTPGNGDHTEGQLEQETEFSQSYPATLNNMTMLTKTTDTDGFKDSDELPLQGEQKEPKEQECHPDSSHCVICLNTCEDRTVLATCHRKKILAKWIEVRAIVTWRLTWNRFMMVR